MLQENVSDVQHVKPGIEEALGHWVEYERLHGSDQALQIERETLAEHERTVAFVGEFNGGKSSLIDCLLGCLLLPIGRFPETGAVSRVYRAKKEGISVVRDGDVQSIEFDETILRDLTCLTRSGRRIDTSELPEEIRIATPSRRLPRDLTLVDTPGLNDEADMRERALRAAERSDAIVWVASSKTFLTKIESETLSELHERRGLDGLIMVVNEFLEEDTKEAFLERQGEDRQRHEARLGELWEELGIETGKIPFLSVSARAALNDPNGFGAPALRKLIFSPAQKPWEALAKARQRAALRRGHGIVHDIASVRTSELEQALQELRAYETACEARDAFEADVKTLVDKTLNNWKKKAKTKANGIVQDMDSESLQRDDTYTRRLRNGIEEVEVSARTSMRTGLLGLVVKYGQLNPSDSDLNKLDKHLSRDGASISIEVPDSRAEIGVVAGGLAVGLSAVFPFLAPVLIPGAIAGAVAGNSDDAESARTQITSTAARIADCVVAKREKILKVALRSRRPKPKAPTCLSLDVSTRKKGKKAPSESELAAWKRLRDATASIGAQEATSLVSFVQPKRTLKKPIRLRIASVLSS